MGIREHFESDLRFYYAVGVFVIFVFISAISVSAILELAVIDHRLIPLAAGFFLFMFVYFISVSVQALEPDT